MSYLKRKLGLYHVNLLIKCLQSINDLRKWEVSLNGDRASIFIPKFRELLDETTLKKLRESEKKFWNQSGINPKNSRTDLDREKDLDKEEDNKEIVAPLVDTASEDAEHIQNGEVYLESGKTYQTKKGKILSGDKLIWFEQFWEVFNYKKGKSEASDAWLEIKDLNEDLFKKIILGAQAEARVRPHMIAKKQTPKMAQGWLSGKRWEDEIDPRIGVFSDATIATMANLDGFMEENNEK